MNDWMENIVDKEFLQDNLTFAAIFIAMYENMVDYVISNIEELLCDMKMQKGKIFYLKTEDYKLEIRDKVVDKKGNKDKTKASFLWLVDHGAISASDYEKFLAIKEVRNKYSHEMANIIIEGIEKNEVLLLFDLYDLYSKITHWFFLEIDAPIMGYKIPENPTDVQSSATAVFNIVIEVLYNGKSEKYKSILANIKEGKNNEI